MVKVIKGFILAIIVGFILCGCSKANNDKIIELTFSEFKEKVDNKESFALYIGNDNCSHCISYTPTLIEVLNEYNITIYKIDNTKLSDEEYTLFEKYINISGTPTIVFIENGEEETSLNRIVGETSKEDTIKRFKTNGYIN